MNHSRLFANGKNHYEHQNTRKIFERSEQSDICQQDRKALMQEYNDIIPVRGPAKFSDGEWTYQFTVNGVLENFAGQEEILLNAKIVYRCITHGGFIR